MPLRCTNTLIFLRKTVSNNNISNFWENIFQTIFFIPGVGSREEMDILWIIKLVWIFNSCSCGSWPPYWWSRCIMWGKWVRRIIYTQRIVSSLTSRVFNVNSSRVWDKKASVLWLLEAENDGPCPREQLADPLPSFQKLPTRMFVTKHA